MIDRFRGKYNFLSNFYHCKIEYGGLVYSSVEAAYQACKTDDVKIREAFQAYDAREAKKANKLLKVREDWQDLKYAVMMNLLLIKFNDPVLRCKLLATGEEELCENNNWQDFYWGVCDGVGENRLGIALMKVRQYFRCFE